MYTAVSQHVSNSYIFQINKDFISTSPHYKVRCRFIYKKKNSLNGLQA